MKLNQYDTQKSPVSGQTNKKKKWIIMISVFFSVLLIGGGCIAGFLIYQAKEQEKIYNQEVDQA